MHTQPENSERIDDQSVAGSDGGDGSEDQLHKGLGPVVDDPVSSLDFDEVFRHHRTEFEKHYLQDDLLYAAVRRCVKKIFEKDKDRVGRFMFDMFAHSLADAICRQMRHKIREGQTDIEKMIFGEEDSE